MPVYVLLHSDLVDESPFAASCTKACACTTATQGIDLLSTVAPSCSNQTALSRFCRLTGRAMFRQTLLAKHGKLVLIPRREIVRSSVTDLAACFQQELEAVAGGSLVPYRY